MMFGKKKPHIEKEIVFSKEQKQFAVKLMSYFEKEENTELKKYINFIYTNNMIDFIKSSYKLKFFGIITFFLGIIFGIVFIVLLGALLLGLICAMAMIAIGAFLYFAPYNVIKYTIYNKIKSVEKVIFNSRYDILRQLYYNIKLYNNPFFIANPTFMKKTLPEEYMLFIALKADTKPAFYEKFNTLAELFSNHFDLSQFFKGVAEKLKNRDFEEFFKMQQIENVDTIKNTINERASIKQTTTVMMIMFSGLAGLFIGLFSYLQVIFILIYHSILSTAAASAGSVTSLTSVLSIFQVITSLPPMWFGFLIIPVIVIILALKFKKDSQSMFS